MISSRSQKIGIVTWFHSPNYGCVLQAIALQRFLQRAGYDCEIVDHDVGRFDLNPWTLLFPKPKWAKSRLRSVAWRLSQAFSNLFVAGYLVQRWQRLTRTKAFLDSFAVLSDERVPNLAALADPARRYDVVLVGSDQIWNPDSLDEEASFLLGMLPPDVRRVAYAPSLAAPRLDPRREDFARALPLFSAIALRERQGADEVSALSGKPVSWVVDPTQLLSADDWRALLPLGERREGDFLLVYCLSDLTAVLDDIVAIARRLGVRVRLYTSHDLGDADALTGSGLRKRLALRRRLFRLRRLVEVRLGASPTEFLRELSSARYVLSDSYHALMFGTLFNRNVRIFIQEARRAMASRIEDFIRRTSLEGCLAERLSLDLFETPSPCVKTDNPALEAWRRESGTWLLDALAAAQGGKEGRRK